MNTHELLQLDTPEYERAVTDLLLIVDDVKNLQIDASEYQGRLGSLSVHIYPNGQKDEHYELKPNMSPSSTVPEFSTTIGLRRVFLNKHVKRVFEYSVNNGVLYDTSTHIDFNPRRKVVGEPRPMGLTEIERITRDLKEGVPLPVFKERKQNTIHNTVPGFVSRVVGSILLKAKTK